jgi:hypothetical protein
MPGAMSFVGTTSPQRDRGISAVRPSRARSLPLIVVAAIAGLAAGADAPAVDANWELVKTEGEGANRAALYRRDTESGYSRYKMEARFDLPVEVLAKALVHHILNPPDDGGDRRVIERGDGFVAVYQYVDLPFPVSDRDLIIRTVWWSEEAGRYELRWAGVHDGVPTKRDVIRVPKAEGSAAIETDGEGSKLSQLAYLELGGSIPAWVADGAMGRLLFEDLERIRAIADARSYGDVPFPKQAP